MVLAIYCDRVINGTGDPPLEDACIIVDGQRIDAVVRSDEVDASLAGRVASSLDLRGSTLLPGLINLHEHLTLKRRTASMYVMEGLPRDAQLLRGAHYALRDLREGVTTVRNVGAKGNGDIALRNAIAAGLLLGPRVLACGEPIAMTGGHGYRISREADGPDEMTKAARALIKDGVDWIKLMASSGISRMLSCPAELTIDEMRAATEEAKRAGKGTCAHAESVESIRNAVLAGINTIEHGLYLDRDTAELMADRGVALVPTLGALHNYAVENGEPPALVALCREVVESGIRQRNFEHALEAGLRIGVGTDTRGEMALEMELLVDAGMSPTQAIEAATRVGAEILGLEGEIGTVAVGKVADLVAVDGNPLRMISALRSVKAVVRGGQVFTADTLDRVIGTPQVPF